ncbi:PhoD-like phosphatase-domain-containing protein [Pholiota molesta]|nr:PhoD-like phosphatase-domain-containing protein [Pholiota molesta]
MVLEYVPALCSTLFRLAVYVFLHIIPSRLLRVPIPALFALSFLATWLFPLAPPRTLSKKLKDKRYIGVPVPEERPLRRPHALPTLLFSLPTHSRALARINFAINALLFLAVLDFASTPFLDTAADVVFTRVGAVYPDSIKLVARYPKNNATEDTLLVLYREATANATWKEGPQLHLTADADWAQTARISNLWPSTSYEYVLADANKTVLPYPSTPIPFRTFPDPRLQSARRFRFVASSCTVPNFPYRGPFHKRSIKGFDLLADYLHAKSQPQPRHHASAHTQDVLLNDTTPVDALNATAPEDQTYSVEELEEAVPTEFMLFLGDFIYADVPFYGGDDKEAYRRLYRRSYQTTSYRRIYEQLPVFHAYDDHEFIDNYAGQAADLAPFANASNAYNIYAGDANYDPARPAQSFYDFRHGDVAFFVMDTRRYRSGPDVPEDERTMLGAEQLGALHDWLAKVNTTASFKFVVSSVPFTRLFTHDAQRDTWAFFPAEQAALRAAFASVPDLLIISGDRHQFAAIEYAAPPGPHTHTVHEISTSPLSMFYVPLVTAIQPRSADAFVRNTTTTAAGAGAEGEVFVEEEVPYERVVKYLPAGNYKWSAFEVDTRDPARPTLRVETVIDGKPAYNLEIVGTPTKAPPGLGALVSHSVVDWFERFGLSPAKWF